MTGCQIPPKYMEHGASGGPQLSLADADTDDDGLLNGEEAGPVDSNNHLLTGWMKGMSPTDPTNPDTDGDGLLDGLEVSLTDDPDFWGNNGAAWSQRANVTGVTAIATGNLHAIINIPLLDADATTWDRSDEARYGW